MSRPAYVYVSTRIDHRRKARIPPAYTVFRPHLCQIALYDGTVLLTTLLTYVMLFHLNLLSLILFASSLYTLYEAALPVCNFSVAVSSTSM